MQNITTETNTIISPGVPINVPNDKISYEKFLEWNGEFGWFEWVDGEVVEMSNPSLRHQQLSRFLTSLLQFWAETKKIGEVIPAPFQIKFDFRPSGRQPDIMFVSNENLQRLEQQYLNGAADLIVEVVSGESLTRDTQEKFHEYEKAGVNEYWIIDYNRRTANFYELSSDDKYQLMPLSTEGKFESKVIKGLWIYTDWLWQDELPNLMDILKEWELV